MKNLMVICFLFVYVQSTAQVIFQKYYGSLGVDNGYYAQQTTDSGYIIVGSNSVTGQDIGLIKTNSSGDTMWSKRIGGSATDYGKFVQQTSDGGYIITGITESFGAGQYDVILVRLDANGDSLWVKTFGGVNYELTECVQQTTDGGFIITGSTNSFGAGGYDVFLIKTDANGDTLWTKTYGGITTVEVGSEVKQTSDGGYIITGQLQTGFTNSDIYLIKTDSTGNLLWAKTYGGTGFNRSFSVEQTNDGGYIITGEADGFGGGTYDVFLIKTDNTGNLLWSKTYGGTGGDGGYSVKQTADGGFVVAGYSSSFTPAQYNFYLIKTNAIGDTLWTTSFGGMAFGGTNDEFAESVQQTNDGGYILTGVTSSFGVPNSLGNYYIVKTDSMGNSGCNQYSIAATVLTSSLVVANPVPLVSPGAFIITTPAITIFGGGNVGTICSGTIGINELSTDNSFLISPNPSIGDVEITFTNLINNGKIELYNVLGRRVFSEKIISKSKSEINLKNISQGIYFVKVFDGEKSYCKKLIVEHD